ncbi:MAG TPA: S-adenosylmethionine:tRNA ribosyltransferase-isomerase [Candidatus Cybelea sp.]|nr:S-adenosylmethionine:tRNA ribosyltransferase-isomerase [Candidatus Cybelea sp.]
MTAAPVFSRGLIEATEPPEYRGIARDGVRMLVTDRQKRVHTHAHFYDLPRLLHTGDLLVVNDSATLPASILARRSTGDAIRLHVSTKIDERLWTVEPRGPVAAGETLTLPAGAATTMIAPVEPRQPRLWYAAFQLNASMYEYLVEFGTPISYAYLRRSFPLPDYQTIFAREMGSSEMPSAARPFTKSVAAELSNRGVEIATVTLHCGVASFEAPERPATERFMVSHGTADRVNNARRKGRRVIAVGTTVVRALESAATDEGVAATRGWTDLIIDETFRPKAVDALLSGFHDVNATHLSLLHAFAEADLLQDAYTQAAQSGYRYHEFGDVHLIQ